MAYLTLFCRKFPKNPRKKSQRSGRGGSSRLGQNPNFYRKFVLHASLTVPWQKFHALKIGLGTRHLFIHRKLESFSPFSSLDLKLLSWEVFEGLLVNWTHWGHGGGASFNCCSFLLLDIVDSIITDETGQHDVQHFVIHSCIFPYKAWKLEK